MTLLEHVQMTECIFGREVWLSCYGVPVHAWNVSTFCSIGNHWGEVVQIDEDTAKSARFDVEKVKEQVVFICNSDFRCECPCHGGEDEQTHTPLWDGDDDNVAENEDATLLGDGGVNSRTLIADPQNVCIVDREEEWFFHDGDEVETRG
ncbi:hypothetical protein Dimus_025029 [Dionaea muscipula]